MADRKIFEPFCTRPAWTRPLFRFLAGRRAWLYTSIAFWRADRYSVAIDLAVYTFVCLVAFEAVIVVAVVVIGGK